MGEAVLAMTDPEKLDEFEDWHFGFFFASAMDAATRGENHG
jgi:hypothetical protein